MSNEAFLIKDLEHRIASLLPSLRGKRILDVGCGSGFWIERYIAWGATPEYVTGIDLVPERIQAASRIPGVRFICGDASETGLPDASQDLVTQNLCLSSALDVVRHRIAAEMRRVLKPGGIIVWYDLRVNTHNPNVRKVTDRELRSLFPGYAIDISHAFIVPILARYLPAWLYRTVGFLSPTTHSFAVIR